MRSWFLFFTGLIAFLGGFGMGFYIAFEPVFQCVIGQALGVVSIFVGMVGMFAMMESHW